MKHVLWVLIIQQSLHTLTVAAPIDVPIKTLLDSACLHCHDSGTETELDLTSVPFDLSDAKTFRRWEQIYDRVHSNEMPPPSEERPDPRVLAEALAAIESSLTAENARQQAIAGRVAARRLTKRELGYTLHDLLLVPGELTAGVPDEAESGSFDTVGASQRISSVHLQSYLDATDAALKQAIQLGPNPFRAQRTNFAWMSHFHDLPINQGGNVTRRLKYGDGIVLFRDADYLTVFQFKITVPGIYLLKAKVAAYQSMKPVTAKLIVRKASGAATLVKALDLQSGNRPELFAVETFLEPGDSPYLTLETDGEAIPAIMRAGGAKAYKGPGLAILSQHVEGPLVDSWPPPSTRNLLHGLEIVPQTPSDNTVFDVKVTNQEEHLREIIAHFGPRILRRPIKQQEVDAFANVALPAIQQKRPFTEVVQLSIRAMFGSPQFLLFSGKPGALDDFSLASRLSYFLWKSIPDDELMALAREQRLSDAAVLAEQVDRMLADERADRFVSDFLGQWLRLDKVNATLPDEGLYPEFDEILGKSIPRETELFFAELIQQNLSLDNLIDSDFTFVNSRLANHYGLPEVEGQEFRRVELPADGHRGGVLTQASILKTTANGTTTSPVTRGNFVLTNLLGTPPSPPPPAVGSIEPDTRGKTTIREILAAHRSIETCATCHRKIDPPGFALESFDPIGGFRTNYRATTGVSPEAAVFAGKKSYREGLAVDPSGVTADGREFADVRTFKKQLMRQKDQIARNFISRLVVYSTGGEIQFADRAEIEAIVRSTAEEDYRVRDIMHAVVQSRLFRHR